MACGKRNLGNSRPNSWLSDLPQRDFRGFLGYSTATCVDRAGDGKFRLGLIERKTEQPRAHWLPWFLRLAGAELARRRLGWLIPVGLFGAG